MIKHTCQNHKCKNNSSHFYVVFGFELVSTCGKHSIDRDNDFYYKKISEKEYLVLKSYSKEQLMEHLKNLKELEIVEKLLSA